MEKYHNKKEFTFISSYEPKFAKFFQIIEYINDNPKIKFIHIQNIIIKCKDFYLFKSENNIKHIRIINCDVVSLDIPIFDNLKYLSITDSNLKYIYNLNNLPKLCILSLINNKLNSIPDISNLINLEQLLLSKNNITCLPTLLYNENLKIIDIHDNLFEEVIDFSYLPNLEIISMYGNNIYTYSYCKLSIGNNYKELCDILNTKISLNRVKSARN